MSRGQYKIVPKEEKVRIVSMVLAGKGLKETVKSTGTPSTTLRLWLADETINPDREYALKYRKEHPWMEKLKRKGFNQADPSPEEIPEVTTTDPVELKKTIKDLRKKIAYLEDKTRYLETLYELIETKPSEVSKKKDSRRLFS